MRRDVLEWASRNKTAPDPTLLQFLDCTKLFWAGWKSMSRAEASKEVLALCASLKRSTKSGVKVTGSDGLTYTVSARVR